MSLALCPPAAADTPAASSLLQLLVYRFSFVPFSLSFDFSLDFSV